MKKLFFGVHFLILLHISCFTLSVNNFDGIWEENNSLTLYNDSFIEISYEQFRFLLTAGGFSFVSIADSQERIMALQLIEAPQQQDDFAFSPAPDFSGATLNGNTLSLQDLSGKPTVLVFFSTTCSFCKKEMPELNELFEKFFDKSIQFVGVSYQTKDELHQAKLEHLPTFPVIYDGRRIFDTYEIHGVPAHIIIDEYKNIVWRKDSSGDDIENEIHEVLSNMTK